MTTINEKRAIFHQYLEQSGVIDALSKALIKLYEEPNKPDNPIEFVRLHMVSGGGEVNSLETKNDEENCSNVIEKANNVLSEIFNNQQEQMIDKNVCEIMQDNGKIITDETIEDRSTKVVLEQQTEEITEERIEGEPIESVQEEETSDQKIDPESTIKEIEQLFYDLKNDENCTSSLKHFLTLEIIENFQQEPTFLPCIRPGFENHDDSIGIYAINSEAYNLFDDLFKLIIEELHGDNNNEHVESNWGKDSISMFDDETLDPDKIYIEEINFHCKRSVKNYPFLSELITENDLTELLAQVKNALESIEDETLSGQFEEMINLDIEEQNRLSITKENTFLQLAGCYNHWPIGRAIFKNSDESMIILINCNDHLQFISKTQDGHFADAYKRLIDYIEAIQQIEFVHHERYGWLTANPINLGTCFDGSVLIKLPKLTNDLDKLNEIITSFDIKLKSIDDNGLVNLSTQRKFGINEFDITKSLFNCLMELIKYENED